MEAKRVLHADADTFMRDAFKLALEHGNDLEQANAFHVARSVSSGEEVLEICSNENFDLIILDVDLPEMNGYQVARELLKKDKGQKIIILSMHTTLDHMNRSINMGIAGHLSKKNSIEVVKGVIHEVLTGHTFFESGALMTIFRENKKRRSAKLLTSLEIRILKLVHMNKSIKEMSQQLKYSTKTTSKYLGMLKKKLGVKSRLELALYAERHKLV